MENSEQIGTSRSNIQETETKREEAKTLLGHLPVECRDQAS